jgi:Ca2+/Na+ antiporter
VQLQRPNPLVVLQFYMVLFCLLLMLLVAFYNRVNPWLSLGFFVLAVINISVILRQHRMLPPRKRIE